MSPWTAADIPDQAGRTALVTGGNAGLGFEVAAGLARAGARVLLACRDLDRAADAVDRLRAELGSAARVEVVQVDLADLGSVRAGAAQVAARTDVLDLFVANAGIMATPLRRTVDGFELQLATNHLGHFALGALLLPLLAASPQPRVVAVSSVMHQIGRLDVEDLHWRTRRYRRWQAYGDSKLANLLWVAELQRRSTTAGLPLRAVAAHPGYADTGLQVRGPRMAGSRVGAAIAAVGNQLVAQPAAMGALPLLYAATMSDVGGGEYFGPDGWRQLRGNPRRVTARPAAHDPELAQALWGRSELDTQVRYDLLGPEPPRPT